MRERRGPTSKTISQLIAEVSMLMGQEKPIPKRNQAAMRLADAAPDLLFAANEVLATWESGDLAGSVRLLAEAVAKAEGKETPNERDQK